MKITSVKNVAMIALVFINIILLSICVTNGVRDRAIKRQARENLAAVMENNGIKLSAGNIREGDQLTAVGAARSADREKALAEALCGSPLDTQSGGTMTTYTGPKGTAVFRSSGDFDIVFGADAYHAEESASETAKVLLALMKAEARVVSSSGYNGTETVAAQCFWKGADIFNCVITFSFRGGVLKEAAGKFPESLTLSDSAPTDMSSAATAVLAFLGGVKDGRFTCSEVKKVEPGYIQVAVSAAGDSLLRPAWKITADTGDYYYDTSTGKIERGA